MEGNQKQTLPDQLGAAIRWYRGLILEGVENAFGDLPEYQSVRSHILNCLGNQGLETRIRYIASQHLAGKSADHFDAELNQAPKPRSFNSYNSSFRKSSVGSTGGNNG